MKTHSQYLALSTVALSLLFAHTAHAGLTAMGNGMVFDSDGQLMWLADASYARSSGVDADGLMSWDAARLWADNLEYGGYSDWRLPTAMNQDGSSPCGSAYDCIGSELGHLFYDELGGIAGQDIDVWHNGNYTFFQNVQPYPYWSSTAYAGAPTLAAWGFDMGDGYQDYDLKSAELAVWAVRSVPAPNSLALFGIGLLAWAGVHRRRNAISNFSSSIPSCGSLNNTVEE